MHVRFANLDAASSEDLAEIVTTTDWAVELGQGYRLRRRLVAGHMRLELSGTSKENQLWLKSLGCFTEILQFQLRVFVPSEPGATALAIVRVVSGNRSETRVSPLRRCEPVLGEGFHKLGIGTQNPYRLIGDRGSRG